MRETQLEQGRKIDELSQEVRTQGQQIDELSQEMRAQGREMRDGFATLSVGMAQITALLTDVKGLDGDA